MEEDNTSEPKSQAFLLDNLRRPYYILPEDKGRGDSVRPNFPLALFGSDGSSPRHQTQKKEV